MQTLLIIFTLTNTHFVQFGHHDQICVSINRISREGPGKSRMCPPYPQRVVKGD